MTLKTNCKDPTSKSHMDSPIPEQAADCQIARPESQPTDSTDAILVAVLRIFAARGRAIREERARLGMAQSDDVQGDQENSSQNQ